MDRINSYWTTEREYQGKKFSDFLMTILITGSIFLTSVKFIDATNTPKFYFSLAFVLIFILINARSRKPINIGPFTGKTTQWGIYSVCFLQACYGLFQLAGWFPSNHSNFAITGSFDNPAGFASVLSLGFPIGLFLLSKAKKIEWYLTVTGLIVIAVAVFFSGSRTGMLAIIISSGVFFLLRTNITDKLRQLKYYKSLLVLFPGLFICGALILYYQKKDSADGRLLVWKVSAEMIKNKPVIGHGYGTFQAKYMDYQAYYFKNNPDSKFKLLADNVKHPFNEFIKVAVEFGILTACKKRFNDYDLQMLMADNYYKKGETEKAIQACQHASNMIPCRFLPIYQLFEIYKGAGEKKMAVQYAGKIINKKVKVPSATISFIQREASEFLTGGLESYKL